jgi:Na+-driven multidrug efflux pump
MYVYREPALAVLLHAKGEPARVASDFLAIVIPTNVALTLGMALSGVLRAVGDARRAMFVLLSGGVVTAVADPVLIFGCGLGVTGAAWAMVISRLVLLGFGLWGVIGVHDLIGRPRIAAMRQDFAPIMTIGLPAILANLATPVAAIYITRVWSDFGEAAVAGGAVIDRVVPLAFGVVFALTGSIGPILGQNYGARLMGRVQQAVMDALILSVGYALIAWAVLAFAAPTIASIFDTTGEAGVFILFFCHFGAAAWIFITCLFVANTVFNNLGYPLWAMLFNWGRATLGTIPFVALGARWGGVQGAILGIAAGSAVFGLIATALAFGVVSRLANAIDPK